MKGHADVLDVSGRGLLVGRDRLRLWSLATNKNGTTSEPPVPTRNFFLILNFSSFDLWNVSISLEEFLWVAIMD